jgi:hypothetical protein
MQTSWPGSVTVTVMISSVLLSNVSQLSQPVRR